MNDQRRSFIIRAVLVYMVLALAWIFLSDQLLTVFVDIQSLVWLSTAKGIFFVLVSAAGFYIALVSAPAHPTSPSTVSSDHLLTSLTNRTGATWFVYGFAIVLVITMLWVRLQMPVVFANRPLLIMFMLPIIVAALLGGFGPGLAATLTAGALTSYFLVPPVYSFGIAASHDLFQWSLFIVNGMVVSLLSEIIHRLRRREASRLHQVEQANDALRQSENRFRLLFHDAPVAMGYVDYNGRIVAQNSRFDLMFGYSPQEIPTIADWWSLAYPDAEYRAEVQRQWETVVAQSQGIADTFDAGCYRITCKNGEERLVRIYSIRMPDGLMTAFLDETQQRQAEERLRLWVESFAQADLGLVITDAQTNTILAVNPSFARQRGYQQDELIGMSVLVLFPADRVAEAQAIIKTMGKTPHGLFETEHITKDGQCFPVMLDMTAVADEDGQPLRRVAYVLDITERQRIELALTEALATQKQGRIAALNQMQDANLARVQAEQTLAALRESEERLALFIEHAPAALAMFDCEMHYLAASRRWYEDYALGQRPLIGRYHYDVFPEIGEQIKAIHRRALHGEIIRLDEDRFERLDGTVQWVRWEVRPWHTVAGEVGGIVIFSEDISRFKKAQEEIYRLNSELEQRVIERTAELTAANRELDSFAYAVSHDLRAPLRAMNGFSQALLEDYGPSLHDEAKMYLDQIILGSRKMGELIDGLLTLSRSTRGQLQRLPVDMTTMAQRILLELAANEPDRQVHWEVEPNMVLRGDAAMLEVVLSNLLANAWKYTGQRDQARIRVYTLPAEHGVMLCVADNGAGFDQAYADKLFQPFQRLHRQEEFPGIGIGLATVQRIIHRHGGTLTAQGSKDQGATFCITLP